MTNLVGSVVPSEKEVQAIIAKLAALDAEVARFVDVHLSAEARRDRLKLRAGGEQVVPLVGRLATERNLQVPGESVEAMNADLTLAQRLRPLQSAIESLHKRVEDGVLQAETECWHAATGYYSVLSSMAGRDPQLASALAPAIDFFATGRRRPKAPVAK